MGYIKQSNDLVVNSSQLLDDILSSKFNQFLQGLGQPVLVTYWNLNDTESTTNIGTDTIDEEFGDNSPNRFNRIDNFPIYGVIKDMMPEIIQNDELLDLEINAEGIILPDTIRPSTFDYFEYRFGNSMERSILFKVHDVHYTTIKSNGYYKIECSMVDIDGHNGYTGDIEKKVTKVFETNLDTIGTNDKCIIESKHLKFIKRLQCLIDDIINQYLDLFYNERYNSLVYDGLFDGSYLGYDPWVTNFIIQNGLLTKDRANPIVLVNFDPENRFRQKYNMTFFHAIELRTLKYLKNLRFSPIPFSRVNTNPFTYYGEEIALKVDIYEEEPTKYASNVYMNILFKNNIELNVKTNALNEVEDLIVDYFNNEDLSNLLEESVIKTLEEYQFSYTEYWFHFMPILVYILRVIIKDIINRYS